MILNVDTQKFRRLDGMDGGGGGNLLIGVHEGRTVVVKQARASQALVRRLHVLEHLEGVVPHRGMTRKAQLVMEHCPHDCTLLDQKQRRVLDDWTCLRIAKRLALTLQDLHERGLQHGNLRLEHVLIVAKQLPLLCGFGSKTSATSASATNDADTLALKGMFQDLLPRYTWLDKLVRDFDAPGSFARGLDALMQARVSRHPQDPCPICTDSPKAKLMMSTLQAYCVGCIDTWFEACRQRGAPPRDPCTNLPCDPSDSVPLETAVRQAAQVAEVRRAPRAPRSHGYYISPAQRTFHIPKNTAWGENMVELYDVLPLAVFDVGKEFRVPLSCMAEVVQWSRQRRCDLPQQVYSFK